MEWGPIRVSPIAHIEGRGYALGIDTPHISLQVWVSDKGHNVRIWKGDSELVAQRGGGK